MQSDEAALPHFDADLCATDLFHDILQSNYILMIYWYRVSMIVLSVFEFGVGEAHFSYFCLVGLTCCHVFCMFFLISSYFLVLHCLCGDVFLLQFFGQSVVLVFPFSIELVEVDLCD